MRDLPGPQPPMPRLLPAECLGCLQINSPRNQIPSSRGTTKPQPPQICWIALALSLPPQLNPRNELSSREGSQYSPCPRNKREVGKLPRLIQEPRATDESTQYLLMNCAKFLRLAALEAGAVSIMPGCAALPKLLNSSELSRSHSTNALRRERHFPLYIARSCSSNYSATLALAVPARSEQEQGGGWGGYSGDHFPAVSSVCLTECG